MTVVGPAIGFIHREGKVQRARHFEVQPTTLCSRLRPRFVDDCVDDDYDPRRAEYVMHVSPEEANIAQVDMLRKQVKSLQTAVKRRSASANEAFHVVQHYELTMEALSSTLKDAELRISTMSAVLPSTCGAKMKERSPSMSAHLVSRPISPISSPLQMEPEFMSDGDESDSDEELHQTDIGHVIQQPVEIAKASGKDVHSFPQKAEVSIYDCFLFACFAGFSKTLFS